MTFAMSTRFTYPSVAVQQELRTIANTIVAHGKGSLSVDQAIETLGKRFEAFGIENTLENRRRYRQLIFTSDKELAQYISSVIICKEGLAQTADNGTPFVQLIKNLGTIPGIQVDEGVVELMGTEGETTTQGLTNLGERLAEYKAAGCEFAKYHCVLKIGENTPSTLAIEEHANTLARYATICQMNRMVPIIESEVMTEGCHSLERAQKVTEVALGAVYKALNDHHVFLEGTLLKANMVQPGESCTTNYTVQEAAEATILALSRTVPVAVPGITFLSGGLSEEEATVQLDAVNKCTVAKKPWVLSFSFGRALHHSTIMAWNGSPKNIQAAQKELLKRAKANSEATLGKYTAGSCVGVASNQKLHQFKRMHHMDKNTQQYMSPDQQQYKRSIASGVRSHS